MNTENPDKTKRTTCECKDGSYKLEIDLKSEKPSRCYGKILLIQLYAYTDKNLCKTKARVFPVDLKVDNLDRVCIPTKNRYRGHFRCRTPDLWITYGPK